MLFRSSAIQIRQLYFGSFLQLLLHKWAPMWLEKVEKDEANSAHNTCWHGLEKDLITWRWYRSHSVVLLPSATPHKCKQSKFYLLISATVVCTMAGIFQLSFLLFFRDLFYYFCWSENKKINKSANQTRLSDRQEVDIQLRKQETCLFSWLVQCQSFWGPEKYNCWVEEDMSPLHLSMVQSKESLLRR